VQDHPYLGTVASIEKKKVKHEEAIKPGPNAISMF